MSGRRGRSQIRLAGIVTVCLALSGCLSSKAPFFGDREAATPLPHKIGLHNPKGSLNSLFLLDQSGSAYIVRGDKTYTRAIFIPYKRHANHFVVQASKKDGTYEYVLVKLVSGKLHNYAISIKETVTQHGLRGLTASALGTTHRAADRSALEGLYDVVLASPAATRLATYDVYDLNDRWARSRFQQIVAEKQAAAERARAEKAAKSSAPSGAHIAQKAPPPVRADVDKMMRNEPFQLNEQNAPFMVGMAAVLVKKCQLPRSISDRLELGLFVQNGNAMVLGNDYSNPNLGKSIGKMFEMNARIAAGTQFIEALGCSSSAASIIAQALVRALRSNQRGRDGGPSQFVRTCAPRFDKARCVCLATLGRGVIPNIHAMSYDRGIIKQIISRNPIAGLQIGVLCRIGNY